MDRPGGFTLGVNYPWLNYAEDFGVSPAGHFGFPHLKSRLSTLWSRSYYAGTVGHVSEATVKKYIENQKGR